MKYKTMEVKFPVTMLKALVKKEVQRQLRNKRKTKEVRK